MPITGENLAKLQTEYAAMDGKREALLDRFLVKEYRKLRAKEYAHHGFLRRLDTLVQCIKRVYHVLPPEAEGIPDREKVLDATIAIQAFTFNVFGIIDNLAWIWTIERHLKKADGSEMPNIWVGLGEKNRRVRSSFSTEFQEYLAGKQGWFELLEDYRHALAHRIPLYIPPFVVPPADGDRYHELDQQSHEALRNRDYAEQVRLVLERDALRVFSPIISHSLPEGSRPIYFHFQLFIDLNTIEELANKIMDEIDGLPA